MSSSIISGGIVAIIAFLLAAAWDTLKYRRDVGRHDRAVLASIRMELAANLPVVEKNQKDIAQELNRLAKGEWLLNPLEPLEAGFWNLAKLNPPKSISASADSLGNLQRVARLTFKVNEVIKSREAFRVGNQESPTFKIKLGGYDQLIQRLQAELVEAITIAEAMIAPSVRSQPMRAPALEKPTLPGPAQSGSTSDRLASSR
ncbi:MAG TPA: hypothetical protein VGY30_11280 [Solirubrobacteraceae bacterium]|jgi:hypothetical protein|nr:hypothetical protein [Solirubrobacteraceae bacterium]